VDYKVSDNSLLFAKGFYSDFQDFGDKWTYTLNDVVTPNPSSATGDPATFAGDKPKFKTSRRAPDYGIGLATFGGNHLFTTHGSNGKQHFRAPASWPPRETRAQRSAPQRR